MRVGRRARLHLQCIGSYSRSLSFAWVLPWSPGTEEHLRAKKNSHCNSPSPKNLCCGLESHKLKISWWYLIVLSIFLQILSCTSFPWPFPFFFFFLPFVTVKGRREGRLKWRGTRITEWRRIIQDRLPWFIFNKLCSCLFLLERGVKMAFFWRKNTNKIKNQNQKNKQTGNPEVVVRCLSFLLYTAF